MKPMLHIQRTRINTISNHSRSPLIKILLWDTDKKDNELPCLSFSLLYFPAFRIYTLPPFDLEFNWCKFFFPPCDLINSLCSCVLVGNIWWRSLQWKNPVGRWLSQPNFSYFSDCHNPGWEILFIGVKWLQDFSASKAQMSFLHKTRVNIWLEIVTCVSIFFEEKVND